MGWDYSYDNSRTLEEELRDQGYQFEFEYGEYGYSWDIIQVWTKGGHVFELQDSGCSCNSFGDRWHAVDEVIGEMREVTSIPKFNHSGSNEYEYRHLGGGTADEIGDKYRGLLAGRS